MVLDDENDLESLLKEDNKIKSGCPRCNSSLEYGEKYVESAGGSGDWVKGYSYCPKCFYHSDYSDVFFSSNSGC
jgi:hypothetical protein